MAERSNYRTKAHEELIAYLVATPGEHHTAAEIKAHFAEKGEPFGTATIYRHLERLADEGYIRKYYIGTGDSACYSFEKSAEACSSHFHCKCETCGKLIHLDCDELNEMKSHLLKHHGFEWNAGKTVFYGTCERCRKGKEAE